jgi:hypothetical protein
MIWHLLAARSIAVGREPVMRSTCSALLLAIAGLMLISGQGCPTSIANLPGYGRDYSIYAGDGNYRDDNDYWNDYDDWGNQDWDDDDWHENDWDDGDWGEDEEYDDWDSNGHHEDEGDHGDNNDDNNCGGGNCGGNVDVCEVNGYYSDGHCDTNCAYPDPDCNGGDWCEAWG